MEGIKEAFESFMKNDFEKTVDSSTKASWSGSHYVVELFHDGTYRTLHSCNVGNLYISPGLILVVPALDDEEWDSDPDIRFYDSAEENLREAFDEYLNYDTNRLL